MRVASWNLGLGFPSNEKSESCTDGRKLAKILIGIYNPRHVNNLRMNCEEH